MDKSLTSPRRCKATNRDGSRCRKSPSLFQEVCRMHGANTAHAKAKAQEFQLRGRDLACGVLVDAMNAEPCAACGRTRDMAIAVRAAIAVLDRTGMGPQASMTVHHTTDVDLSDLSLEELITEFETTAASLRAVQEQQRQRQLDSMVIEGEAVIEREPREAIPVSDEGEIPTR